MIEVKATIRNEAGIHCRPSALIVKTLIAYEGAITISTENGEADCRSIMGLLSLAMEQGTGVTIWVEGPEEEFMSKKMVELFETEFDFPPIP